MDANEFKESRTPEGKKSRLTSYKDDIFLLKESGFSERQILEFLEINNVKVSRVTLSRFIRAEKTKHTAKNSNDKTDKDKPNTTRKTPKFDWKNPPSIEELI